MAAEGAWQEQYRRVLPLHERLLAEVLFAIEAALSTEAIKIHSATGRVKTLESLAEKAERKGYLEPLDQASDVVGVRVVVLFLSDIPRVEALLRSLFTISGSEDHIEGQDAQTFGYMSRHFDAAIR